MSIVRELFEIGSSGPKLTFNCTLGLEKSLKHVKGILKSYVKGKIYSGFSDVAKKFIKQRGGKV